MVWCECSIKAFEAIRSSCIIPWVLGVQWNRAVLSAYHFVSFYQAFQDAPSLSIWARTKGTISLEEPVGHEI